ncbi:SDR family oxidoreductase [Pleomorphovibrio marinus]|uniref:SDR family oxidoreductase n=1 Tax=Pleomorphovibrio marinus TaxID=2164132 RepID=UPI000E0A1E77|nr:SDR family oxidoreductase [Pleomorphovibrio marinus]
MKTVLITGTNRGIGMEAALAVGRAGHKVFATTRNPEKAFNLKQQIKDESLDIHLYKMDVDSDESVSQCINTIIRDHGSIDVLVNNAGIVRHGSIEELPLAKFKAVMDTNYFGAIRCIKAVLPSMRKNKSGCIINVSSMAGKISLSPLGPYCASKFALEAMTEALAQELKPFNVRVSLIEPGIINTDMAHEIGQNEQSLYPQVRRIGHFWDTSLQSPVPPSLVADKILEAIESSSWQLRYPVGPDAEPFWSWRTSMDDEQWVDWNAQEDKEWYSAVESTFGMNCRPGELEKEK